jgi:hypothetical protein
MDNQDPSPLAAGQLQFSDHLLPALRDAAVLGVETACDGEWEGESQLGRVRAAVHILDALEASTCTREQVGALAESAVTMQGEILRSAVELDEPAWPTTREEADALDERARLTRELIEMRDAAGGAPPQQDASC